jgi:AraC-like DNA-binding protein
MNEQIDLNVLDIDTDPKPYHFVSGSICLFISVNTDLEMPMGPRSIPLPKHSVYLFYDQKRSFDLLFKAKKPAKLCIIKLSIDTLHHIIAQGNDELNFTQTALFEKEQYHHFEPSSIEIQKHVEDIIKNPQNVLLTEAKKFEILNEYFNTANVQKYKCPFLNQKDNVNKVREAKEALIANLQESITIKELAKLVGLNEYNLKTGFKEIYGKPVHSYLKDYKISKAKEMLQTQQYKVNEIADKLGYSNVSHFINGFKKKYGITPKQFEMKR